MAKPIHGAPARIHGEANSRSASENHDGAAVKLQMICPFGHKYLTYVFRRVRE